MNCVISQTVCQIHGYATNRVTHACACALAGERWIMSTPHVYPTIDAVVDVASVNSFTFRVKACGDARVDLASSAVDPDLIRYSFFIGASRAVCACAVHIRR